MYVTDIKYYTDYNQASGKVIYEYRHRRNGSFPFFDLNFWAETHRTERIFDVYRTVCKTVENAALNPSAITEVIHECYY